MVIENVHGEEQRELWLAPRRLLRLPTAASKRRIGASNADNPSGQTQTLRHDETPKLDRLGSSLAQPRPAAKAAAEAYPAFPPYGFRSLVVEGVPLNQGSSWSVS